MSNVFWLLTAGIGWFAAVQAFRQFWGEGDSFAYRPAGIACVVLGGGLSFALFAAGERGEGANVGIAMIMTMMAVVPYGLYFAGLMVQLGQRFFSTDRSMGEHRSYDKGDAAMARHEYELAVQCFRQDLARWPGDFDATLRLGRALEAAGEAQAAAGTLHAIRFVLLEAPPDEGEALARPALSGRGNQRRDRGERILALTYALGDLYAGPLGDPQRAKVLYEETLQKLYGFPNVDPLRERLRVLSEAVAEPRSSENIAPARLSLD